VLAPDAHADSVQSLVDRLTTVARRRAGNPSRGLLAAVPGIGCLVTSDGEIREWNERAAEVAGADAGADVTDLVVSEARERLTRALDEAVETGRSVVDAPASMADPVTSEWTLTRLADDTVAVVGLDVSERVAAAAELRETEASLATLYEALSDRDLTFEARLDRLLELGCDRLDVDHGFLTRITGNTQHIVESVGTHPSLQPGDQCPLSEAYCRKTIRGDGLLGVHNAVEAGWEADPAYEAFGLGCYLGGKVLVDGDLYGTLCFADDESKPTAFTDAERTFVELLTRWVSYELEEQAAREKLERQNERLSEFASIVSHDLRNPLNVAKGKLELARETGETAHLDEAEDALDRMEALVTNLLDLARQGSIIETADEVDLATAAMDAWANVATEGADLVVETDASIEADRDRLLQLLENLFRNSVEHGSTDNRTESGDSVEHGSTDSRRAERAGDSVEHGSTDSRSAEDGPTDTGLTVRVGPLDGGFYVEDTGPGIPPDERDAVFERGHSTDDGTGLGLTIVQAIADAHGWSVTVAEGEERGARFEFSGVDSPVPLQ
jgi:signal transduction histidine kinase